MVSKKDELVVAVIDLLVSLKSFFHNLSKRKTIIFLECKPVRGTKPPNSLCDPTIYYTGLRNENE